MRMSARFSLFVACVALAGIGAPAASGGDQVPAAPPAPAAPPPAAASGLDAVAEAVVAALKAKNNDAVGEALEAGGISDYWLVADAILGRGDIDAAAGFAAYILAESKGRPEYKQLPAYVEGRRKKTEDVGLRRALAAAEAAVEKEDGAAALKALDAAGSGADGVTGVRLFEARGDALLALARREEAAKVLSDGGDAAHLIGWDFRALGLFRRAGQAARDGAAFPAAVAAWHRLKEIADGLGIVTETTTALSELVGAYLLAGRYAEALEFAEKALAEFTAAKDRVGEAKARESLGKIQFARGDDADALQSLARALKIEEELDLQADVATTLASLGNFHAAVGHYDDALACYERGLKIRVSLGNETGAATIVTSIGNLYAARGENAKALDEFEKALAIKERVKDRTNTAVTLGNIGLVEARLGNYVKALEYHERALALKKEVGDRAGAALTLDNIGNTHYFMRDYEKALECHEEALKMEEDLGDKAGTAWTIGNIGLVQSAMGRAALEEGKAEEGRAALAKAVDLHARALKISEGLKDAGGIARGLKLIGAAYAEVGDSAKALEALDRAVEAAEALRSSLALVNALKESATERLRSGDAARASAEAHRAVTLLPTLVSGLADEQGATAREVQAALFGVGTRAAAKMNDAAEVAFFVESGRSGTLLEALGGGDALRSAVLPPELVQEEVRARAETVRAQEAYARAYSGDDRRERSRRLQALEESQKRLTDVVERIQRTAKRQTSVLYAKTDGVDVIGSHLKKDEALVEYALTDPDAFALVVTAKGARIVPLGKSEDIVAKCDALQCSDASVEAGPQIADLGKALIEPLALGADVHRVLLSPEGALSYIPFCALNADVEFAYVPSGTTYGMLKDERAAPGTGYFALGDPYYGDPEDPTSTAGVTRGGRLLRLAGTLEEAKSIGEVVLVGKEATEAGLREALAKRPRWRAIHFACHGLVNSEFPMQSSLALSPSKGDDGFLTAQEVMPMKISADLVVMSACETSRGKIFRAEGVLGLSRAFMMAGAPSVICSLWSVNDEATRDLMKKFYEAWKAGVPAAKALKDAQTHIRSQEKWKHPVYWAAWVLWGLPD